MIHETSSAVRPTATHPEAPTQSHPSRHRRGSALPSVGGAPLPSVLCVDDDAAVLRAAQRVLSPRFAVTTALSPAEALSIAQQAPTPFAVVVADLQMPGLSGIGLLQCIRQLSPETVRVLLSGNADLRAAVDAVNAGEIYRFITKPYEPEHLVAMVSEASAHHETLVDAAARGAVAPDSQTTGYVTALNRMLEVVRPDARESAARIERRVREIVTYCSADIAIDLATDLCAAAALSQIGAASLPVDAADRIFGGAILSATDVARADGIAIASAEILANVPALAPVREILYATAVRVAAPPGASTATHGSVAGVAGVREGVDLAGRILAAAIVADQCSRQGMVNPAPVLEASGVSPALRERVRTILARDDESARVRTIPLAEVRPGMTLAADVVAPSGVLFAARGQVVTAALVARLHESWDGALLSQLVRVSTYAGVVAAARPRGDRDLSSPAIA